MLTVLQTLANRSICHDLLTNLDSLIDVSNHRTMMFSKRVLESAAEGAIGDTLRQRCERDMAMKTVVANSLCTLACVLGWTLRIITDTWVSQMKKWTPGTLWAVGPPTLSVVFVARAVYADEHHWMILFYVLVAVVAFVHCAGLGKERRYTEFDTHTYIKLKAKIMDMATLCGVVVGLCIAFGAIILSAS